jgi:hypothetical protein
MKKIISPILIALLLSSFGAIAVTKKVLFIGNSYTFTNNMPSIVDSIARAMGDTLVYDMSAPGGYTLQQHCTNLTTITKLFSQRWDVVIIHEQSQMPAFPPSQVATDVYPYARILDSMVRANDTCTQTMFMMTWGHANGDPMNCPGYPVICTYDGMQMRLRESYLQMATDNHADVAPVGSAFRIMVDSAYTPWLFSPDSSHPVFAGSYLEALVIYTSVFHKSTKTCTYNSSLTATDATLLKRISDKVTLDSLALFQGTGHYPNAYFTHSNYASPNTFTTHSPANTHHYWSFGDGTHDTTANPAHTFASGSSNTVTHTVTTNCFTETYTNTVLGQLGVATVSQPNDVVKVMQQAGGNVTFELLKEGYTKMEIYDSKGSIIRSYDIQNQQVNDNFTPGLYIYRVYGQLGKDAIIGKLGAY